MKLQLGSNMKRGVPLALALLFCMAGASAQMFKWVDANGVVHYSDQPPDDSRTKAELRTFTQGGRSIDLPYGLAQAARSSPVTLYTTGQCDACNQGRSMLRERGIPFTEKTVNSNEDQQKLREAGSDGQLPLLVVGNAKLVGFEPGAWNAALNEATYPAQTVLPRSYQYPVASSAAPPAPPKERPLAREQAAADSAERAKTPAPDTPPGFQF